MNHPTNWRNMSLPKALLHLEGAAALAASIALYSHFGGELLPFVLLFLVPDLSLLGYVANARLGGVLYNTVHTYLVPALVLVLGLLTNTQLVLQVACIWLAHISMDRTLGLGLRYLNSTKETHFQRV
jgi:hypothetical protein